MEKYPESILLIIVLTYDKMFYESDQFRNAIFISKKIVDIAFSTNLGHASTSSWIRGYIE